MSHHELPPILLRLIDPHFRHEAIKDLSTHVQGEVLLFITDPALGILLPAPGFPQTISEIGDLRIWIESVELGKIVKTTITFAGEKRAAYCIRSYKAALLLLTESLTESDASVFAYHLPQIAYVLTCEFENSILQSELVEAKAAESRSQRLRDSLDRVRKELQTILRAQNTFLSIAAHELKTPISTIKAYTQIFIKQSAASPDERTGMYLRMETQINRLVSIVNDLTISTQIQEGKLSIHRAPHDIGKVVGDVVHDFAITHPEYTFDLSVDYDQPLYIDRTRIEQVVINLISNAVKYSADNKRVAVRISGAEDTCLVSVQDYGVGIKKEETSKLFNKFYRVRDDFSPEETSLGLGLFIAAEIVKKHGGTIQVESEFGIGSTFSFSLPAAPDKISEPPRRS